MYRLLCLIKLRYINWLTVKQIQKKIVILVLKLRAMLDWKQISKKVGIILFKRNLQRPILKHLINKLLTFFTLLKRVNIFMQMSLKKRQNYRNLKVRSKSWMKITIIKNLIYSRKQPIFSLTCLYCLWITTAKVVSQYKSRAVLWSINYNNRQWW